MTTHTPLVAIERPMNNLTIVTIGPSLEFAFSYETIIAFRTPSYGWLKSENVWSPTTGRHLNSLPGQKIDHVGFLARLAAVLESLNATLPPVGEDEQGPLGQMTETCEHGRYECNAH